MTGCKGPKDCLYPNPDSCNNFIQCTVNADNKTGTPVVMPCASATPPLEWNDIKKKCDYAGQPGTCSAGSSSTSSPSSTSAVPITPTTTPKPIETTTEEKTQGSSSSSPPVDEVFVCPVEDIANNGCKGPKDCLYPNPDDCHSFIQCRVNGENKTVIPVVVPCAPAEPPLEWNDNKKECDYPVHPGTCCSSDLSSTSASSSSTTTSTAAPAETTTEAKTDAPTDGPSSTSKPSSPSGGDGPDFVCPVEDIANTSCKGPKDCLYPNSENCNSFIQCTVNADNKTGTPVVMPCPSGLEWNDNKKVCDWPVNSTCN